MLPEPISEPVAARVLLVEDDVTLRLWIAEELRDAGFTVIEAKNADEASTLFASGSLVDLIFSDVRMPGSMNGLEFARQVKAQHPTLPIVITSGDLGPEGTGGVGPLIKKALLRRPGNRPAIGSVGPFPAGWRPMSQECILLAEDDILVRHPLAEYLRECGYKVVEASGSDEARQILKDGAITVDVVLADIDHQQGSGFALASWIRANFPSIDVVLAGTVAKATEKAGDLCEEGPAVSKPYDHQLVLDRIRRLRAARDRAG